VILYAERTYKIDVKFDVLRGVSRAKLRIIPETVPTIEEMGLPRQFFDSIRSIKIVERPFDEVAAAAGMPVNKLVDLLDELRREGVIRDFYAMFDPDAWAFGRTSMVVFNAPMLNARQRLSWRNPPTSSSAYLCPVSGTIIVTS